MSSNIYADIGCSVMGKGTVTAINSVTSHFINMIATNQSVIMSIN